MKGNGLYIGSSIFTQAGPEKVINGKDPWQAKVWEKSCSPLVFPICTTPEANVMWPPLEEGGHVAAFEELAGHLSLVRVSGGRMCRKRSRQRN